MSTYIQGLTDYIPQIQPFQPDFNFFANVMQTRQSRYDSAKKQVSDLYGSLLNSPMLRENNIKRRDEFFKVINEDIQKISGMDLSLKQNENAALGVFKGFYDDKYMVNDMVKTKKLYSEIEKGKSLKNCNDPEKCGGQYWEPGMQKLYYKMDEFKNASDDESLNFDMGSYDSYYNWKKDAIKAAKDMNYDVQQDSVTGQWIIHNENGELVQGGLYNFFKSMYGDDPRVSANYDTMAYVARKNAAKADAMTYGSEDEAEKQYIMKSINKGLGDLNTNLKTANDGYDQLTSRYNQLEKKKAKGLTPQEQKVYDQVVTQRDYLSKTKTSLQSQIDEINNNIDANDINSLRVRADRGAASSYEYDDMMGLAKSLADIKKKRTIKENPYGVISAHTAAEKELAKYKSGLDLYELAVKHQYDLELEDVKNGIKRGAIPNDQGVFVEGAGYGNVELGVDDDATIGYKRNQTVMHKTMGEASAGSSAILLNMLSSAKKAYEKDKSAGAKQFLDNFGPNYNTITTTEQLNNALSKKGLTSMSLFRSVMGKADQSKNPTGDYEWAQPLLQSNADQIAKIKASTTAFNEVLAFNLNNNKKVVDAIKGTTSVDNPVAKYADLMITKNGFLVADDDAGRAEFTKKYIQAKVKEGDYNVSQGDAEDAFEALSEQFFDTYNKTKDVSIEQGIGLEGTGMLSAYPVEFKTLDSGKPTKVLTDILTTTSKLMSTPAAAVTVALGDASEDVLDEGMNDKAKQFINSMLIQALTANAKKEDRPKFNAVVSPIAANNENLSAITFKDFNPDFLKDYVGTKDSPGPLYKMDISKGITVFYDNTQEKTPFKKGAEITPEEVILKTRGSYTIDSYANTAGKVDLDYDKLTNTVTSSLNYFGYKNGEPVYSTQEGMFDMANFGQSKDYLMESLKQIQALNLKSQAEIAAANKNK